MITRSKKKIYQKVKKNKSKVKMRFFNLKEN